MHKFFSEGGDFVGESPFELTQSHIVHGFVLCMNQICYGLCLGKVHATVHEGTHGVFAWIG